MISSENVQILHNMFETINSKGFFGHMKYEALLFSELGISVKFDEETIPLEQLLSIRNNIHSFITLPPIVVTVDLGQEKKIISLNERSELYWDNLLKTIDIYDVANLLCKEAKYVF